MCADLSVRLECRSSMNEVFAGSWLSFIIFVGLIQVLHFCTTEIISKWKSQNLLLITVYQLAVEVSCSQIVLCYAFLFHICVVKCNPYSVLAYTVFHGAALCYLGPLICLADVSDGRTLRSTAISHLAVWTGFVGDFINSPRNIRELSGGKFCHGKVAKIVNKK